MILAFGAVGLLGLIGVITLLYLSWYHTEGSTQFFTQNLLNLLLLGAIIVQAVIYTYQWIAMRDVVRQNERLIRVSQRQARIAEKALKLSENTLTHAEISLTASERAYISVRNIQVTKALSPLENPIVHFDIVNGGRTPARAVKYTVTFKINNADRPEVLLRGFMPPESSNPLRIEGRIGTLFSDESHRVTHESTGLKNQPEWETTLPRILAGTVPFYFLCHVAYTDFQERNRAFQIIAFYDEKTITFWECGLRELMFVQVNDTSSVADKGEYAVASDDEDQNPN